MFLISKLSHWPFARRDITNTLRFFQMAMEPFNHSKSKNTKSKVQSRTSFKQFKNWVTLRFNRLGFNYDSMLCVAVRSVKLQYRSVSFIIF